MILTEFISPPATTDDPESGRSPDERPEIPLDEIVARAVDGLNVVRRTAAELARRAALTERDQSRDRVE